MREKAANPPSLACPDPGGGGVPLRGGEPVRLRGHDGVPLRGELCLPPTRPRALVIFSHAMMVDRRALEPSRGPGLLSELVASELAVLWLDQRGHGQSVPLPSQGARWDFDDLVADVGAVLTQMQARFPSLPRIAVGHSLFGLAALAYQARASSGGFGAQAPRFDALVLLATNPWLRRLEPRPGRWLLKRAAYAALLRALPLGYLPVRALGLGSADEPAAYLRQLGDWTRRDDWTDRRGRSYLSELPAVSVPVLSVVGQGDRLMAVPECQLRLLRGVRGPLCHWPVGRLAGDGADPGHIDLLRDPRLRPRWHDIARWIRARVDEQAPSVPRPAGAGR
ncbi:MAG: alpha/beta hydrolase [Polyangia bacterium]